jgi:long-chain acyl-CoA synthetase
MIPESLRVVAGRHAERLAIIDGNQRITYGEFFERVGAVGEWLGNELGPQPGIIAAALDNSWQFAACFFAASTLGYSLMPCNPQWRAAELQRILERLGLRNAIIEPRLSAEWNQILDAIPGMRLVTRDSVPAANTRPSSPSLPSANPGGGLDDPTLYLATSGSLGTPRLVPRSHRNLVALAGNVGRTLDIGPDWRLLGVIPFHYSNGFHNSLVVPLLNGATIVMLPQFNPRACAELVQREQINTLFGSPFIYASLLDGVHDRAALKSLQRCFSAGGRMSSSLKERWQERFGVPIRQLYGMTETGAIAIESSERAPEPSIGACVGPPIHGVEVVVCGPDGANLAPGEIAELRVRSASVMAGYAGESEPDRSVLPDGFFRTGDLGFMDSHGTLHLTGRLGRVMNIAGVKVDPVEVERAIELLAGVSSCHVDAVPNGAGGEVVRARVVARQGVQLTRRLIIEHCRQHLADYKFPRVIEFLEASPVSIAGKIPSAGASDDSTSGLLSTRPAHPPR